MQRMHAFLFNDGLLLAPWIPNRFGLSFMVVSVCPLEGVCIELSLVTDGAQLDTNSKP